ncbi:MAG: tetratricopeptide repeat protein [Myxococcales bacterium]|nr:tetratricopeptide repeat protein [Myxococcales bacterium]
MAYQPEIEKLERRYQEDPARNFAQLAERYRKDGRLDEALDLLRRHLDERPNYVSGLIVLGRCFLDQENDAEARETFTRVLAVDAEHIIALRALGEIAERSGDPASARQWFTRLLDIDPMNEEAERALERLAGAEAAEETPEVRTAEFAGTGTVEPAEPVDAAEAADGPELTIERASTEYQVEAADLEPMDVEQWRETELAADAAAAATPGFEIETAPTLEFEPSADVPETGINALMPDEVDEGEGDVVEPGAVAAVEGLFGAGEEEAVADEEVASVADAPGFEPFDESLGWDAGERVSHQVSAEDIAEAEAAQEEGLEAAVQELPGLQGAEVPDAADIAEVLATPAVEGLQRIEAGDGEVVPVEGFETHDLGAAEETVLAESDSIDELAAGADVEQPVAAQDDEPWMAAEVIAADGAAEPAAARHWEDVDEEAADEDEEAYEDADVEEEAEPVSPPAAAVGGQAPDHRGSLEGLPVFLPDDEPDQPLVLDPEPEPVVTETMAELYLRQGLVGEARDVFRRLVAARPGDARLQARLAELERPGAGRPQPRVERFAASATGGQRVRDYLADVLAGRPTPNADGQSVPGPAVDEPSGPEPMDEAFGEASGAEGRPTQPAPDDEVSLSTIFGDGKSSGSSATNASGRESASGQAPGGFSFDEFYGSSRGSGGGRAPRDTLADDEGDDAFRDWLKSLKS